MDPVYGDPALRAQAVQGFAKGNLVAARHRYVMERWGADMLATLVGRLSGRAAELLERPPLPMGWHPIEELARIDAEILMGPMEGDLDEMRKFGFEIASYDLSTLYRMLFKVGTPGFIVGRLPVAFKTYLRDTGELEVDVGKRSATATMVEGVVPYYLCTAGMSGWMEAALVMSGASAPSVEHAECRHRGDPRCVWRLEWSR